MFKKIVLTLVILSAVIFSLTYEYQLSGVFAPLHTLILVILLGIFFILYLTENLK